jgi:hypothetical protein
MMQVPDDILWDGQLERILLRQIKIYAPYDTAQKPMGNGN